MKTITETHCISTTHLYCSQLVPLILLNEHYTMKCYLIHKTADHTPESRCVITNSKTFLFVRNFRNFRYFGSY